MPSLKAETIKMQARTKEFALRIVRLVRVLPKNNEGQVIGRQLLRAGTSVAANYRATCRARSHAEFISKMSVVLEEADESAFWLELLSDAGTVPASKLMLLRDEADQLVRIFASSLSTARR